MEHPLIVQIISLPLFCKKQLPSEALHGNLYNVSIWWSDLKPMTDRVEWYLNYINMDLA